MGPGKTVTMKMEGDALKWFGKDALRAPVSTLTGSPSVTNHCHNQVTHLSYTEELVYMYI